MGLTAYQIPRTNTLAPVVLFAFARPDHTKHTLDALSFNLLAEETNLIIYVDAANLSSEEGQVQEVLGIAQEQSHRSHR